jgi:TetR/AcrR family transcriptional regulator, transcriptional repressor of bet genes
VPGTRVPEAQRRVQILQAAVTVAAREGLAGLTVRKVAEAAGISAGLVLFHYQTMEALREALLDWLLERVLVLDQAAMTARSAAPREHFLALLAEELAAAQGLRTEIALLVDYWVQSQQQPGSRQRLQQALAEYRAVFRALAAAALADAGRPPAVFADALADLSVRSLLGLGMETLLGSAAPAVEAQVGLFAALLPEPTR